MLKRSDLTKQFELVVKQEIINYQDSLNNVLKSLRELKEEIDENRKETLCTYSLLKSLQIENQIKIEDLRKKLETIQSQIEFKFNDQIKINLKNDSRFSEVFSILHDNLHRDSNLDQQFKIINDSIHTYKETANRLHLQAMSDISNNKHLLEKSIERAKEEILSKPTDSQIIKKELEEKLNSHSIDVNGLLKEIRNASHQTMVVEKKIENIYTLLDRLKKKD